MYVPYSPVNWLNGREEGVPTDCAFIGNDVSLTVFKVITGAVYCIPY